MFCCWKFRGIVSFEGGYVFYCFLEGACCFELVLTRLISLAYSKLFKQANRQTDIHIAIEPVRPVDEVVAYKMIERKFNYLSVPKDMLPLNIRLLESEEYTAINVNTFMKGFDTMGRYKYMNKAKAGLATPFQLWI